MKKGIIIITLIAAISACAAIKVPQATGGSKADGIVELSYTYGGFEKPDVQWDQAQISAQQRCEAWGYSMADAFGGTTSQCQAMSQYGCTAFLVTAKYQCTN